MTEPVPSASTPLAIVGAGTTVADDGTPYPTVVLDVTGRPDVADLARVHAVEGIGDVETLVEVTADAVLLTIRLTRPVRASFVVRFDVPDLLPVLTDAVLAGHLLLATTPPAAAGRHPLWLAIDLDGPSLAAALLPVLQRDDGPYDDGADVDGQ